MAEQLISRQDDGKLAFGDISFLQKQKEKTQIGAHYYKVKTFRELTRLERDDYFVYESDPGTVVSDFESSADGASFTVEGPEDAQIVLGMADDTEYQVYIDDRDIGSVKTGLGGKLAFGVELEGSGKVRVRVEK